MRGWPVPRYPAGFIDNACGGEWPIKVPSWDHIADLWERPPQTCQEKCTAPWSGHNGVAASELAQLLPSTSAQELDAAGSFVWSHTDGACSKRVRGAP